MQKYFLNGGRFVSPASQRKGIQASRTAKAAMGRASLMEKLFFLAATSFATLAIVLGGTTGRRILSGILRPRFLLTMTRIPPTG